jgi:hypothetical protein
MISKIDKKFPLTPKTEEQFESKRELMGLFRQRPLETEQQFAERVFGACQEYQERQKRRQRQSRESRRERL